MGSEVPTDFGGSSMANVNHGGKHITLPTKPGVVVVVGHNPPKT